MSKNEGTQAEIQRVYENGRRNSKKGGTRGKFSLKSLNNGSLDTVENNTDNVQIKSDNFKIGLEIGKITRVKQVKL